jgi:outer membrane beta-barrel protein
MRLQNTTVKILVICSLFVGANSFAQSKAYQRKKAAAPADAALAVPPAPGAVAKPADGKPADATAAAPKKESEKLDIQELEQKYWAPKDTDFSVVQNRTYTKAGRWAASVMYGPVVSDPFSSGFGTALNVNYYFDERYGVELMYQSADLSDSDATKNFRKFAGGGIGPDFNRDLGFYGVGFNWVPFYAKMSFLGQKIIYFDMQITPFVGMTSYEQQSEVKSPEQSEFAYGIDITQYFFFSKNMAVRAVLHNRFYKADVLAYTDGVGINAGEVKRSGEATSSTMFLMGLTYFF